MKSSDLNLTSYVDCDQTSSRGIYADQSTLTRRPTVPWLFPGMMQAL